MAVWQAKQQGSKTSPCSSRTSSCHRRSRPILQSPLNRVQGFLGPGHVCTVMGYREVRANRRRFHVPIVITGFEPLDLLQGTLMTVRQLEAGKADVENQYAACRRPRRQPGRPGTW